MADAEQPLVVGTRVRHPKFGLGTVQGIAGGSCWVRFEDKSLRKIVARFLEVVPD